MARLTLETAIFAPVETVFDAARGLDLHLQSAAKTGERIVAGRRSGLMELGDETTFEARHFGLKLRHSARISRWERPHLFRDEMTRGAFAFFLHDHEFAVRDDGATLMRDTLIWRSPLGILGVLADEIALKAHLRRFLRRRNRFLKTYLETRPNTRPNAPMRPLSP